MSEAIGLSHDGIRNRWARIYDCLDRNVPGVLPIQTFGIRGRERRRAAIAFAIANPWELMPYDLKGLQGLEAIQSPLTESAPV